eukprot:Polyplicarium_translucidae@DN3286_c0_g1_i5.p1
MIPCLRYRVPMHGLVYIRPDMRPYVVQANVDGTEASEFPLVADPNFVTSSTTSDYSIAVDEKGYVHIAGEMTEYPLRNMEHLPSEYQDKHCMLWKSAAPLDASSFVYRGNDPKHCPHGIGFQHYRFTNDTRYCSKIVHINGNFHDEALIDGNTDLYSGNSPSGYMTSIGVDETGILHASGVMY